jgi:flagellar basal-body rod modification protein FlgD
MDVKRSTQTFSKAPQSPSIKTDGANNVNAQDFKKAYGDQNVGDVLNKAADPNYVDPAKKSRAVGNNQLDKDAFLKLMLTQMKNQDPTNPQPTHEMAAQLAQFTSLEQLNNINSTLGEMKNASSPSTNYQALALIGKKVSGDSAKLTRASGDTKHSFNFDLMADAQKVNVVIKDAGGNIVRKMEMPALKKGQNSVEWNGIGDDGMPARAGEYKFSIDAKNSTGAKVYAKTSFEGRITGLNYGPGGPVLLVGDQTIKMTDVKKIEDPALEEAKGGMPSPGALPGGSRMMMLPANAGGASAMGAKAATPITKQTAPLVAMTAQEKSSGAKSAEIAPAPDEEQDTGNINDVPMAQGLLNKIAKETK